jgi:heme/copper-type cytochrome/quinol oxidase subunit 1
LSQHLFWFFGHPEVYVLIIPTFGIINMVLPYSSFRRVASKQHMIWAIYVMGYMGFLVWGHHMYLVGLDHRSRTMYSTITIMISLPATIKMSEMNLQMEDGKDIKDVPMLFAISYMFFFTVAGFTGM